MSSENYPVANVVEQAVNNQVNALVGNHDVNLNTIVKLSLMNNMEQIKEDEVKEILNRISSSNKVESYFIQKEYELTYDLDGNIIPVDNINGEEKGNTTSIVSQPE